MKKNFLYLLLVLALGATTAWFFFFKKPTNTLSVEEKNFTVEDTASVDRIFFTQKTGASILLERQQNGTWTLNHGGEARIDAVDIIMETFKRMAVKSPVPINALENVKANLVVDGIKVEVYQKGEKTKTMYIGSSTKDFKGTYMMLEGAQMAYIMYLPGWEGYITPRFFLEPSEWKSREIFRTNPTKLASVSVEYPTHDEDNFTLIQKNSLLSLMGKTGPALDADTSLLRLYSTFFNGIHCEGYEPNNPFLDSVVRSTPLMRIQVSGSDGKKTTVRFYPFFVNTADVAPKDPETGKYTDVERLYFYREETKDFGVMQLFATRAMFKRFRDFRKG
jgi:hypothetical protein